ncbi:hypothetical protein [Acidocella aminolytica]|jgi:hypothetical protein|uniref:Uncharacterized protein n=1 Tax=Acidocella aminolytica 101 = DSM 11237 TaxID=1120923 RepID=A0A0D6PIL7_9PROT|nr:hypothetical protein [Acidocella aminolytica]GAN81216.1 hypothetical protein Aam_089_009 [Acidocella aminolytica 101 = DSM 11237]GBQ31896.1 hypothetical protein AA11237_0009 [Acidocella aminolytica 101 = DSM 11237]SHE85168.1 hypothetical protein SAMN02746095_01406 [Acidocella aminolytica 101 = DSM 11237]
MSAVAMKPEKKDAQDRMPRVKITEAQWSDEQKTEFLRRRRARNYLLLAALGGFCLIVYVIAMVKLHEYGRMW